MIKVISPIVNQPGFFLVNCPGCENWHRINTTQNGEPTWNWDGNEEKPTFSPSLFVNKGQKHKDIPVCHSFIRNGVWEFLNDCTHKLAGQKIPMVDIDKEFD